VLTAAASVELLPPLVEEAAEKAAEEVDEEGGLFMGL
jgi:hypothetical protein